MKILRSQIALLGYVRIFADNILLIESQNELTKKHKHQS